VGMLVVVVRSQRLKLAGDACLRMCALCSCKFDPTCRVPGLMPGGCRRIAALHVSRSLMRVTTQHMHHNSPDCQKMCPWKGPTHRFAITQT
jgi:hypothetical protein